MSSNLTITSTLIASTDLICAELASDEASDVVILSLKDGVYYELNAVGARIWALLEQPRSLQEVAGTVLSEFDVEAEQCEADVLTLAESLVERGLASVVDGPSR